MEAVAARIPAPVTVPQAHVTVAGLRRALGDCVLAVSFLLAMLPAGRELSFSLAGAANVVWLTGAAIMAVMSFARFAPRSAIGESADDRRIGRDADPPVLHASDQSVDGRARDGRT